MLKTYNQDAHTARTIKQVKMLVRSGKIQQAVDYSIEQAKICEQNTNIDASKAFKTDVLFAIKFM